MSRTPERQFLVMISRRDINHDLEQPTVVCHPAILRDLAAARAVPTRPANDGSEIAHYPRQKSALGTPPSCGSLSRALRWQTLFRVSDSPTLSHRNLTTGIKIGRASCR